MKLKDARENYSFNSGKTSDLVRQLGLAGIAVIWLFKSEVAGAPKVSEQLLAPLVWIVLGLAFDLLQYAIASGIWGVFQRRKELAGTTEAGEFLAPRWFNWPALFFFWGKAFCIAVAYFLLLRHLARILTL